MTMYAHQDKGACAEMKLAEVSPWIACLSRLIAEKHESPG